MVVQGQLYPLSLSCEVLCAQLKVRVMALKPAKPLKFGAHADVQCWRTVGEKMFLM